MSKNGFLTPKAIGNRIKAKGLQKLRWYCQMCQKQCRDENGFKCHCTSEGHLRQMEIFGMNPARIIEGYSEEFEKTFLQHLSMTHKYTRVQATVLYNEYIADKNHVHMNSTKWTTLTAFVQYLGREGKCIIDETPKGWFLTLVEDDPFAKLADAKRIKRAAADEADDARHDRLIAEQIERARLDAEAGERQEAVDGATDLVRDDPNAKVVLSLGLGASGTAGLRTAAAVSALHPPLSLFADAESKHKAQSTVVIGAGASAAASGRGAPGNGVLAEMMRQEIAARQQREARSRPLLAATTHAVVAKAAAECGEPWLKEGIIVKVMASELREAGYYKQKGEVLRLLDRGFVAELRMLDSGDVLRVDQAQLETVLPAPGGSVLVVGGSHAGCRATLLEVHADKFCVTVRLQGRGEEVDLEYEEVSKLAGQPS